MRSPHPATAASARFRRRAWINRTIPSSSASGSAKSPEFSARADIAVSSRHAAREKLGIDIPAEVIPEVPVVPRRPFFGPEDVTLVTGMGIGILIFAGAALGAFAVVASGGSSAAAALAALVGGSIVGSVGAWIARRQRREHIPEVDVPNIAGELVLFVRVRSTERESKARQIFAAHGAEAVRD